MTNWTKQPKSELIGFLLMEDGGFLLLEDTAKIIISSAWGMVVKHMGNFSKAVKHVISWSAQPKSI